MVELKCGYVQSGNSEVVGSSPAGGEKLAVGIIRACIADDSTLSAYNLLLFWLYTPEWRLRKSILLQCHRPAGVIMCEAIWVCILHRKALYKTAIIIDFQLINLIATAVPIKMTGHNYMCNNSFLS